VTHLGERRHQDPEPCHPSTPAEVEVVEVTPVPLVERSGSLQGLARDEHRAGRDEEHLQHAVVLTLVPFVLLEGGVGMTEGIHGATHLAEDPWVVPVDHLRSDHTHLFQAVDTLSRLDQARHRVGRQDSIVVQDQQVVGASSCRKLGRGTEGAGDAAVFVEPQDAQLPQRLDEQIPGTVHGVVVDRDDPEARIALRGE
jgi:hypothetical protein